MAVHRTATRGTRADITGLANGTPGFFAVTTVNVSDGENPAVSSVTATPNPVPGVFADLAIKQQADGRFRVSLRSRGNTDVAAIAQGFGGGGHRLAAGYTSTTGLEETALALIDALCRGRTRRADG